MGKYKFYIVGPVLLVGGAKRNQNWQKLLELLVEKKCSEQKFVEHNKKSLVTLFKLEGREWERSNQTMEILEVSSHFDQKKEYQRHRRIDQVIKYLKSWKCDGSASDQAHRLFITWKYWILIFTLIIFHFKYSIGYTDITKSSKYSIISFLRPSKPSNN